MTKIKEVYICSNCGCVSPKWNGKCPDCNEWNTFEKQVQSIVKTNEKHINKIFENKDNVPFNINQINTNDEFRYYTGIKELDRVLGGGLVKGSLVLLGGDPGIGKSTLLLQICQYLGGDNNILYVSGEESIKQIKLRANRLGVNSPNLYVYAMTNINEIVSIIKKDKPDIVMIDSIQTMLLPDLSSSQGSITQVRECTNLLMQVAKCEDIPIIVVGHVNKDGAIAGPKVLEHIVDAVLYFEGERHLSYRILRAVKNRYGSTNEIGVFEMEQIGLIEVENPSMMLLSGRAENISGSCVACIMEGSRPILAEIQALVTKTGFGTPRRMSTGFDYNRMNLIIAVLEKRAGYFFGTLDVYINVVGGLKLDEPATDLSIAMALISSLRDKPIDSKIFAFGEIGLGGEIRIVSNIEYRIREAERLGFKKCIIPYGCFEKIANSSNLKIEIIEVRDVKELVKKI